MDWHTLAPWGVCYVCEVLLSCIKIVQARVSQTLLLCRVELNTQDGTSGGNSAEAEALIHAAQAIFALGGAHLLTPS